jgi:hypothetical protein
VFKRHCVLRVPYIDADPIDIVPRAYDMFRNGREKNKNKVIAK